MKSRISTLVIGLAVVLSAQVGVTAAATDTSGALASGTLQGKVRIHLAGTLTIGPECLRVARGRFTLSGATSDRGTFVNRFLDCHRPLVQSRFQRRLHGGKGTIRITGRRGYWSITGGTEAYAGLRGRGRQAGRLAALGRFEGTMTGTLSR